MRKKIFRAIFVIAMIVLASSLLISNTYLYNYYRDLQVTQLKEELQLAKVGVENDGLNYLQQLKQKQSRFTLVNEDGRVIFDSEANLNELNNHLDREEIQEALDNGYGSSARYSNTLTKLTFYEAILLDNGDILRISCDQLGIMALLANMSPIILLIIICCIVITLFLSKRMTNSIIKPLEQLDLEHPASNDTYAELTPVLKKLTLQHQQITLQMENLEQKSNELTQIISSLKEGLILLDLDGNIIRINDSAKKLFHCNEVEGLSYLSIEHRPDFIKAINAAMNKENTTFEETIDGKQIKFMISSIIFEDKCLGVEVLCLDISDSAFAKRNREEFSANVSHELKSPLQSIIGSAELLEHNLVKQEDYAKFIGNIKREAKRLVDLINDIINLSKLDEKQVVPLEDVDLYDIAIEVIDALNYKASQKDITLKLKGNSYVIKGVKSYLYEIIYNLCENAINYNPKQTLVEVMIKQGEIRVKDNGIGIPLEHQSRIFERFYRVDKSHSKASGGSGLGLSIVKNAVEYHHGSIELISDGKNGSEFIVKI